MQIVDVQNNYKHLGIQTRVQTAGEELNMVNGFIEYRKNSFKHDACKQLAIFVEPKINNAYPDIIFVEFNPVIFENWNKIRNSLDLYDLKILNCILEKGIIKSEEIIKVLSIKYKGLLFSLEKLYDSRLIERYNGHWQVCNNFIGILNIESVEAKISKWNEVLQQALLNKNFSSESSILSKLKVDIKNEIHGAFDEFGIGIYLFNEFEFSMKSKPQHNQIPLNHNSLLLNEWVGRILNN